jgi:hypothetical protein
VRRLAVVGVVVAAMLMCCGGKEEPLGPTATVPQGTTTTNPYAIPPVIDAAYVNRVLAGLDQVVGDVTRLIVSSRKISPEAVEGLRSIYVDEDQFQLELQLLQSGLSRGFEGVREHPGNRVTTISELISTQSECVFAKVNLDASAVAVSADPALQTQWIAIVPLRDARAAIPNITGWGFIYQGFEEDQTAPSDPCAGS